LLSRDWQIVLGTLLGIIAACLAMLLCSCSADQHSKTSDAIWNASRSATAQKSTLGSLKGTVDGLTPQNLPAEKPKAQALTGTAIQQNADISKSLGTASTGAKQDAATIKSLSDPVKVRLNWIGVSLLIAGIAAFVCGLVFATQLGTLSTFIVEGGIAASIVGILVLFVAQFLHTLYWVFGSVLVIGGIGVGVWLVVH
jgi:hypothetical protein